MMVINNYSTDLMQHRVCMRVLVVLLTSACDSTRECEVFYSRMQVVLLASASAATRKCEGCYLRVRVKLLASIKFLENFITLRLAIC